MGHRTIWEDEKMVGYRCDKASVGFDAQDVLTLDSVSDPHICATCGKRLTLHWSVRIEESEAPNGTD